MTKRIWSAAATVLAIWGHATSAGAATDARFREVPYDAHAVVTVPVDRAVPTLILLGPDELITDVGIGLASNCKNPPDPWCVAAEPGGRTLLVKPKTTASSPNHVVVMTDKRVHSFKFSVRGQGDARPPVHVLVVKPPVPPLPSRPVATPQMTVLSLPALSLPVAMPPEQIVAERLQAKPLVMNTQYSLAEGPQSQDIVPTLVFDDGRFTYLRFPGNREVPAVFHVLGDGNETLVNARMEGDLLVVDRVSRRLTLRAGNAVVGIWNEAFDMDGAPPDQGTTIPGVQRVLRAAQTNPTGSGTGGQP